MHIKVKGVNQAFNQLVFGIHNTTNPGDFQIPTVKRSSRYGDTLTVEEPVIVTYSCPIERVLFNPARDANCFFHLYEALHMLAGRNDVAPLAYYASRMKEFSDDGKVINDAYGYRWRHSQVPDHQNWENGDGVDQLEIIVTHLKTKPDSRRAVLQMWNVEDDLLKVVESKAVCCNTHAYFSLRETGYSQTSFQEERYNPLVPIPGTSKTEKERVLDMTVCNRSNDLCLSGETKFRSPEGDTAISVLAQRFQNRKGYKFPIYAVDTVTGDQCLCWMSDAWKSGVKPVFKVVFDDGSSIRLTGDHRLFKKTRTFEGKRCTGLTIEERQVCDLKAGDRVLADVPEKAASRSGDYVLYKNNLFSNTKFSNMEKEHRAYWEFVTGEILGEDDIHHVDENGRNNKFSNLCRMSRSEHRSYHLKKDKPNNKMTPEQVFERASKGGKTHKGRKRSDSHCAAISAAAKISQRNRKRDGAGRYISNHKIVSIVPDGHTTVYDFTVPRRHNAVLSNGVVVHNCWGITGANAVHFSFLLEYMAARLGVEVGVYNQFTNNLHVYTNNWQPEAWLKAEDEYNRHSGDPYEWDRYKSVPLVRNPEVFERELPEFVEWHTCGREATTANVTWSEPFLVNVAEPMLRAFHSHKRREYGEALRFASSIEADDWRIAATEWILRRRDRFADREREMYHGETWTA